LLSKLTVGTETAGNPRASMKGAMGTVPPLVRMRTGCSPECAEGASAWASGRRSPSGRRSLPAARAIELRDLRIAGAAPVVGPVSTT
jgi:hypothetical protein